MHLDRVDRTRDLFSSEGRRAIVRPDGSGFRISASSPVTRPPRNFADVEPDWRPNP